MRKWKALALTLFIAVMMSACEGENAPSGVENDDLLTGGKNNIEDLGLGSEIVFGAYEQDNNLDNGKEPIEWIVLETQKDRMLLLSKDVLDAGRFHEGEELVYWKDSTIRKWLNEVFFTEAFSEKEQKTIRQDEEKVFFLSEAEFEKYFELAWGESGHFYDNNAKAVPSDYALSKGLEMRDDDHYARWYLRSEGKWGMYASVSPSGAVSGYCKREEERIWGIRPAVWVSANATFEVTKEPNKSREPSLEDLFPEDWEGRYVIEEDEYGLAVYCKMAYDAGEVSKGWLFSLNHRNDDFEFPECYELGMYDGYPVEAMTPWDVTIFTTDEITAEYRDMFSDIGPIFDAIRDRIAELEHYRQVDETGFDMSLYGIPDESFAGVYQLDCGSWSEKSKRDLLGEYNHSSYLSISPNGDVYLSLGSQDPVKGKMLMANFPDALPEEEPECIIWFEPDNIVKPVYLEQLVFTIHGMEDVELSSDAPKGLRGSEWTYVWVSGEYWTEESLRDDIG